MYTMDGLLLPQSNGKRFTSYTIETLANTRDGMGANKQRVKVYISTVVRPIEG